MLLGAAVAGAEEPSRARRQHLDPVGIELVRLPVATRARLVQELDETLAPAGIGLGWRWGAPGSETRPDQLRIALLDSIGRGAHAGGKVLGASGLTGPVGSVWIYVPNVAAALGLRPGVLPESLGGARDLGTALGRVVAHEIAHALAPELPHGGGLLTARFHLGQLAFERPRLDDDSARALFDAARSWRLRAGPLPQG